MVRRWILAVFLVLSASVGTTQDQEQSPTPSFRLFGQTTSYLELNEAEDGNSDEDYTKFKQLLSFNVEWSKWTVGAQVEYLYYSDPELADRLDLDRLRDTLELRRYYVDYTSDHFQGRLGTFFSSLGRGLTLFVQKNEALGFDEPIHGGTATVTFDHIDVTVLGGKVTEPVLQNQYNRDFEDTVWGGRILARLPHDFYVGGSFVHSELDRFYPEGVDDVDVWSLEAGNAEIGGVLDVHAEWAELERVGAFGTKEGYGGYLSASSYFGPFTILGEYKDYWNFQYRYNSPPNAGRAIESYSHNDVKGPRLIVSADILSIGAIISGSYGWFDSHKKETSPGGTGGDSQNEWYVTLEEIAGPVYFLSSYFNRNWADRKIREEHIIADLHLSTGEREEFIVGYDQRLEKSSYFSVATHRSYAGYSVSPYGVISVRYAWEDKSGFETEDFWGLELQYLPKPTMTLTLFGGADPGGLVCAGGQCRIEPQFKGYKATFSWRF